MLFKVEHAIVMAVGMLLCAGVCDAIIAADGPADATSKPSSPPSSAATRASKKPTGIRAIVAEVQALGGNGIPSSTVFAKELVAVLTKHKATLPDGLSKLVVPKPPVPRPTEVDVSRVYRQTHRIVEICEQSTWTKIADFGVSVSLRNDLLVTVAKHCPSSIVRVAAARVLGARAMPDAEGRRVPDVSPAVASESIKAAITHALDSSSGALGADSAFALKLVWMSGLPGRATFLKAMALDKPTKEALDKFVKDLATMVVAAQQAPRNNKAAKDALGSLANHLKVISSQTAQCAQMVSDMHALRAVLEAFLVAANKEDTKRAEKFLTKKTAAILRREKRSLLEWFANARDVKEVRLIFVGPIDRYSPVQFTVIDSKGNSKHTGREIRVTKSDSKWLLGGK